MNLHPGDCVLANVSLARPPVPATIHAVEGEYGIGWCIARLADPGNGAEYVHIPLNRCARVDPIESSPRVRRALELRDRMAEDRAVQEANARAYDRLELCRPAENHAD